MAIFSWTSGLTLIFKFLLCWEPYLYQVEKKATIHDQFLLFAIKAWTKAVSQTCLPAIFSGTQRGIKTVENYSCFFRSQIVLLLFLTGIFVGYRWPDLFIFVSWTYIGTEFPKPDLPPFSSKPQHIYPAFTKIKLRRFTNVRPISWVYNFKTIRIL